MTSTAPTTSDVASTAPINRKLSIAPMMGWTDGLFRTFIRYITKHTLLYTEMITTWALLHGNQTQTLKFNPNEHPLALQLGGNNPQHLAVCAKLGEDYGYDELNLNLGCPSERVHIGRFGACLMAQPQLVADCILAMQQAVTIPVTVKHRIGIDGWNSYEQLHTFVTALATIGCTVFIVHARQAKLGGLSPKENRTIPPLRYEFVHQLKQDFPNVQIIINGGITDLNQATVQLQSLDGVMIGRAAYHNPWLLAAADQQIFGADCAPSSRHAVMKAYLPQAALALETGIPLGHIVMPLLGLFQGQPGARAWRRFLSESAHYRGAGLEVLSQALELVPESS